VKAEFEPIVGVFIDALQRALPAVPADLLNLRLGLAMGATLMFGIQVSSMKIKRDARREAAFMKELVRFSASGLASPPTMTGGELARLRPPVRRKRKA
jgi:predicted benzoate:H+ symporter BenE